MGASRKNDGPFNEVFEFPNVAWPSIVHERPHRLRRNPLDLFAYLARVLLGEVSSKYRNILRVIAQGRSRDRKYLEAVVEVASKKLVAHHLGQVAVGGGDEPDVNGNGPGPSQPLERLLLQRPEQFGLQIERNIANLIQKQCASVRHLEAAQFLSQGAGECSFFVAEQLAFEKPGGDRSAIQANERLLPPRTEPVNRPGDSPAQSSEE